MAFSILLKKNHLQSPIAIQKSNLPEIKAGGLGKDLNLRVDVRHTNENDRHFYLRFDTTRRFFAGERSYFHDNWRVFAVRAHWWSFADRPGGPLVHQHMLAGLSCIFTSTCLLDLLHLHQHLLAGLFCT